MKQVQLLYVLETEQGKTKKIINFLPENMQGFELFCDLGEFEIKSVGKSNSSLIKLYPKDGTQRKKAKS
jgi:hypothetical protein